MGFMSREEFDSIVKHHISPVMGRVSLNPDDLSYTDHLNNAYDRIFEDFNQFFGIPADYPETVYFDGVAYSVNVDRDSDGEIQYFQLVSPNGELFFEMDWTGAIDEETIVELVEEYNSAIIDTDSVALVKNNTVVAEDVASDEKNTVHEEIVNDFDFLYSVYADYPDEFKIEVMNKLSEFSDESSQFQRILVSESAENWDEFGEC